jgi:hypothetical protein
MPESAKLMLKASKLMNEKSHGAGRRAVFTGSFREILFGGAGERGIVLGWTANERVHHWGLASLAWLNAVSDFEVTVHLYRSDLISSYDSVSAFMTNRQLAQLIIRLHSYEKH